MRLSYWGYDGKRKYGELVVAASVVGEINAAFKRFYDARYQFASIRRVEAYGGSDTRSMAANNTSAFNCRRVTGGTSWSEHPYGTAIDMDPGPEPLRQRLHRAAPRRAGLAEPPEHHQRDHQRR